MRHTGHIVIEGGRELRWMCDGESLPLPNWCNPERPHTRGPGSRVMPCGWVPEKETDR